MPTTPGEVVATLHARLNDQLLTEPAAPLRFDAIVPAAAEPPLAPIETTLRAPAETTTRPPPPEPAVAAAAPGDDSETAAASSAATAPPPLLNRHRPEQRALNRHRAERAARSEAELEGKVAAALRASLAAKVAAAERELAADAN